MLSKTLFLLVLFSISASAAPQPIPAPQLPISTPGFNFKATANFDDLRHNILDLIGSGRKRVWLLTDYLSDGEIASALFLAKYRNLDVKVYLGRDQLSASGSRLPYLRGQGVPTFLRPRTGYTTPTLLFVDQKLYGVTRDLNALQRLGSAELIQASPADVKAFVSWLKSVMEAPEIAYPKAFKNGRTPKEPFQGDSEGSYNYDRRGPRTKAPEGVLRELPRIPKWKQVEEMRKKGTVPPPETPETPTQTPPPVPPDTISVPVPVPVPNDVKKPEAVNETLSRPEAAAPPPAGPPAKAWDYTAPALANPPAAPGPSSP
ncbi:MAG: hypothetical protein H7249_12930 [Chitinophagaceae bacterium]|nr:hypothetical protein [Oligoflexus sp.]